MANQAHVRLLYAAPAQGSERFFEIRRCAAQIWFAEGGVHTWGKAQHLVCDTEAEAERIATQLADERLAQGFQQTHAYSYAPDSFDYSRFIAEITEGLERFWRRLRTELPSTAFDRLALCTDSDAITIGGSLDAALPEHSDECLYIPSEWKHQEMRELDAAYRMLLSKHRDIPFESSAPNHTDNVLECMVRSLEALRVKAVVDADALLTVFISDNAQITGMFERLNSAANVAKLQDFYGESDLELAVTI